MAESRLDDVVAGLQSVVRALDPSVLEPRDAERLVTVLGRVERMAAAGKALCAKRVAESGAWRASGARSEADWLARVTGETVGVARRTLDTVGQLEGLEAAAAAFRSGRLSGPQARDGAGQRLPPTEAAPGAPSRPRGGVGSLWPRGETVLVVDLAALRRGVAEPGETCEIAGVGPVPVSVAERLLGESLLKIVIRDGVEIRTVVHTGRRPTAAMLTALLARDGARCIRPHCDRPVAQVDHTLDWADNLTTRFDHLAGLCQACHNDKTRRGHTDRRTVDGWEWRRPDGTVERADPRR